MKGPIAAAVNSISLAKSNPNAKNGAESVLPTDVDLLTNPIATVQSALEKKLRNLGKRTQKLQQIKLESAKGTKLTEEQLDAISKASEVELQVDFIKDLQKLVTQQLSQYQRAARKKEEAANKKTQENNLNLVKAVLQYQKMLKTVDESDLADSINFLKLTSDEMAAFRQLRSQLTASNFNSFEEWEAQMNNFAKKIKDIYLGSQKEVVDNVTGIRLQTLFHQFLETPIFQIAVTKTETKAVVLPETLITAEEAESDESSLNDFHQDSVDSSGHCIETQKGENGNVIAEEPTQMNTDLPKNTPSVQAIVPDANKDIIAPSASPLTLHAQPCKTASENEYPTKVEVTMPTEISHEAILETTTIPITQPDNTQTIEKEQQQEAHLKTINEAQRPRNYRGGNSNRFRRDQRFNNQQQQTLQVREDPNTVTNNATNPAKPYYNRTGPQPNNYKGRKNNIVTIEEIKLYGAANATAKPDEMQSQTIRRSEHQRSRFFRNDNYNVGEGNGNQARRPYMPRNQEQQNKEQRNGVGGGSGNGGYGTGGATRNYERVHRVHQPYECGLRFARD